MRLQLRQRRGSPAGSSQGRAGCRAHGTRGVQVTLGRQTR